MSNFYTNVKIDNKSVEIQELKLKNYKTLQKALLSGDTDFITLINNFTNILNEITSLSRNELLHLNYIDYCKLLFHIRSISMGNIISAHTTDTTPIKIDININNVIKIIDSLNFKEILQPLVFNNCSYYFQFKLPTISNLLSSATTKDISILKYLYFTNLDIDINESIKYKTLYEDLPASLFLKINKRIELIINNINKINLLEYMSTTKEMFLPLSYDIPNIVLILKLLFTTNLNVLYENMFALSKMANIPPNYLEECTPGEYNLYVKLLQAIIKTQNTQTSQTSQTIAPRNYENVSNLM